MPRTKKFERPSGAVHGASIKVALANKRLKAQLAHCGQVGKKLELAAANAAKLTELVVRYDDLVGAFWEMIPKDLTQTSGPIRRALNQVHVALCKEGENLGVDFYVVDED